MTDKKTFKRRAALRSLVSKKETPQEAERKKVLTTAWIYFAVVLAIALGILGGVIYILYSNA
ncbi:hypothetical protein [Sicyoidochytrium minutum DNA virus]|nr:hypothetical protein [Sicyoidochytrium minutum DNA virus]BDC16764.1 hypothetical protein [Sicyoidochytrium minutum DNA virus]